MSNHVRESILPNQERVSSTIQNMLHDCRRSADAGDAGVSGFDGVTQAMLLGGNSSNTIKSLLKLQRSYGNRYVQRVLAAALAQEGQGGNSEVIEHTIENARGSGAALDTSVRRQMESRIGADFRHVRVHTDSQSDNLNRVLDARAFTTGKDIFFAQGEYQPATSSGRHLLAHELTHVMQQGGTTFGRN